MISCEEGKVKLSGTPIDLTADVICVQEALVKVFSEHPEGKEDGEKLIKNVIYSFTRSAAEKGFSTTFTEKELSDLEETWKEVNNND